VNPVALSYASEDKEYVEELAAALKRWASPSCQQDSMARRCPAYFPWLLMFP